MKKTMYEKSIQNARIDLDLNTNTAKFSYPTKKLTKFQECMDITGFLFLPYMLVFISVFLIYSTFTFNFYDIPEVTINYKVYIELIQYMLYIFSIFIPPLAISFVMVYCKRSLLRHIPKLQYIFARRFSGAFIARFENIKTKTVEIPLYSNVILKYEATGECGKYLTNIKIIEHSFMRIVTRPSGNTVKPNKYLWKAIFKFSKIPKTGKLDVYFI